MAGCGILLFVFVVFSSRSSWSKVQVGPSLGFGIPEPILSLRRRLRLADAEHCARVLQGPRLGMIYCYFQALRARFFVGSGSIGEAARIVCLDLTLARSIVE